MPYQKDIRKHTTDIMEVKLGRMNFIVAKRQEVLAALSMEYPSASFEDLKGAVDFGRRLGVQAVLQGVIDEAYEHVGHTRPAVVSAVAIRLRLVDVASGRVFWQGAERSVLPGWKLYDVLNRVTDILTERLGDDFITQNL